MKAWLITWEWMADSAAVWDPVAAILNPRISPAKVASYMEFLYVIVTSNLTEQASYAKDKKNNPYPAKSDFNGHITCGAHPWLHGQIVSDLVVERHPVTRIETLSWRTASIYHPTDAGPVKVRDGTFQTITRRIIGPVSHEVAWDRLEGRFKDGFGPHRNES